ncbi:P-loop containing nucleoside triphosphate hydrolase protein [Microthyrium microscopicum]|uniref:ATP-dependent RNA helicase ROK1 n=1 Tax=Microthyrium microscopicum TaxID=703497 RepID=A0A6A6UAS4_9PEZI|nr:P-loop containing nucleoside triphosphate hydrolase protein [Microthyrium microscopicum]
MDFFKLLTRSSKLPQKNKPVPTADAHPLPSAGQNANPQLFGRENGQSAKVLGKRKRTTTTPNAENDIPAELDFFGASSKPARPERAPRPAIVEEVDEEAGGLDEWKTVLRKHKVKLSLLTTEEGEKPSKKKKKKTIKEKDGKKPVAYVRPLSLFSQLSARYGVRKRLVRNVQEQGYDTPTEIQLAGLPLLLGEALAQDGGENVTGPVDLLAVAPTGSGKTLAFLIPVIHGLLKKKAERNGPRALVLAPTKELANQIVNECRKLALGTGIKVTLIKKGMRVGADGISLDLHEGSDEDSNEEEEEDKDESMPTTVKSDIIVATPMALVHALERKAQIATLPSVEYLVLDEADVLLDPLFQDQTLSIWNSCTHPNMRTSLWSATMASSIETLALSTIKERADDSITPTAIVRLVIGIKDSALSTVSHKLIYAATEPGKLLALRQLLHPSASTTSLRPPFLVFTQTIPRAIALHAELRYDIPAEAGGPARLAVLHAGLSDHARSNVMARFRRGDVWVVITTDVLARGVDFRGLNGVVNYDVPTSAAGYIHRAGRTGRAGREGGMVVTLYTKEDVPFVKPIANVIAASEKVAGKTDGVQRWLLDALPTPSKRDRKEVKQRGIEARRPGVKGAVISTKLPKQWKKTGDKMGDKKSAEGAKEKPKEIEFSGFD